MICSVHSLGIQGIVGSAVVAECYISNGLPGFDIVGLPDAAVKEARERVRAAAKKFRTDLSCQPDYGEFSPSQSEKERHPL